ncbi:hypothetical protein LEMLEM_LOCUS10177 [Lemmus lemmus]
MMLRTELKHPTEEGVSGSETLPTLLNSCSQKVLSTPSTRDIFKHSSYRPIRQWTFLVDFLCV